MDTNRTLTVYSNWCVGVGGGRALQSHAHLQSSKPVGSLSKIKTLFDNCERLTLPLGIQWQILYRICDVTGQAVAKIFDYLHWMGLAREVTI